jgi:Ca-activated chloride channel family protein
MFMKACGGIVALFLLFSSFDISGATQTTSSKSQATSFLKPVESVILMTTVTNKKGGFATGLQRDDFRILIDKSPADIIDFREEDVPLSVGIVFDVSGSVGGPQSMGTLVKNTQQALRAFLETSNQSNEYFLMAFNIKPQLLLDWTSDHQAIIDTLSVLQPKGNTAFYDAFYLAIDKVRNGRNSKRVLILISDGQDNISTYSLDQVREELKTADVLVYSVNFSGTGIAGSMFGMEGQQILNEFSLISGGMFFYKRNGRSLTASDATSVFETIAEELRHQYTMAVAPNVSSDSRKWHKIKIKVAITSNVPGGMKNLSARTREGFYFNHR